MRISNNLLIGLIIIVLIALNLYVIPLQKKIQLELEKNALWEFPCAINLPLDYVLLSSNRLIQSFSDEPLFKLQSFDLKTGELMCTKQFSEEVGVANEIVCIEDVLYVVFATSAIYKLDATTLETIWRIDWSLEVYDWEAINVEQSKDLLLISSSNPYWKFYTFIKQETGEIHYYQKQAHEYIIEDEIVNIFSPYKEHPWDAYYNFKNHKFVFDDISKEIQFIEDDYLLDISDSLELISYNYDYNSLKNTYNRTNSMDPFSKKEYELYLKRNITASYKKKITNIQTSPQTSIFRFSPLKETSHYNDLIVDYSFIKNDTNRASLNIHNIATTPQAYVSDDYFVALEASNSPQGHQEILIADLNTLCIKKSFYIPPKQALLKLLCDKNQLYALIQKVNRKTYWLAVPITF